MRTPLLTLLVPLVLVACVQDRRAAYPPGFVALEPGQVHSEMAKLNTYMHRIDQVLLDGATISSEQQQQIIAILAGIDEVAGRLGADGTRTGHPLIDENIDYFKQELDIAMRDASASPPNYYTLGRLSGSCRACHRQR